MKKEKNTTNQHKVLVKKKKKKTLAYSLLASSTLLAAKAWKIVVDMAYIYTLLIYLSWKSSYCSEASSRPIAVDKCLYISKHYESEN